MSAGRSCCEAIRERTDTLLLFDAFADVLRARDLRLYLIHEDHNIYRSLREGEPCVPFDADRPALLAAHLVRV